MIFHIIINKLKNIPRVTIVIEKNKDKCSYPVPELCPDYNEETEKCTNPTCKCSYRHGNK